MWAADRNFRPEGHCLASRGFAECHCLASRGFAEWCKTMIPRDGIFYPHRTLMFDSFSCVPFDFECFILKAAFITTHNNVYMGHFLIWRHCDVAVTSTERQSCVTSYTTNANRIHAKIFFLGWDNICEIRISIPSENPGFPYLACEKKKCPLFWTTFL